MHLSYVGHAAWPYLARATPGDVFVVHYKEVHDEIRVQGVRLRLATG